jgi:hypothetical protein
MGGSIMKTILSIALSILLCASSASARMGVLMLGGGGVAAAVDECASTLVCENFESAYSWTEYVGSGATVDESYATAIRGAASLRIVGGADWGETYVNHTAAGTVYGAARIRIVDLPASATNFISVRNGLTELVNLQLRADGTVSSQGVNNTSYGSYAMSTATTYYIWWYYSKGTSGDAVWWVRISDTRTMPGSNDSGGTNGNSTADASRIQLSMQGASNEVIYDQVIVKSTSIGNLNE